MTKSHVGSTLRVVLFAISVQAYAQFIGPSVIQRVEPIYGADADKLIPDLMEVKLVLDERGDLYSLDSMMGLSDNVVGALAKWKFRPGSKDGKPVAITVSIGIPVRIAANELVRRAIRPSVPDELDQQPTSETASKLTPESAAKLEQKLKNTADSAPSRAALLIYASRRIELDKTAKRLQTAQISWFVRNQPGTGLLSGPAAMIFKTPGDFQNIEGYEQIKALWLKRLAENRDDAITIGHATYFMRISDPELAEQLLVASIARFGAAAVWLGELYGLSALGVTRLDLVSGLPVEANATLPDAGFGSRARSVLESSDDVRVLLGALDTVSRAGGSLAARSTIPAGYSDFCNGLLAHAKKLYADATASCDGTPTNSTGRAEPGRITKRTAPEYPAAAKAGHIDGKVVFTGLIGKDGKIKTLDLLRSPLVLYESARLAVSKWEYQPFRLQGEPVEVVTEITVNYKLQ